MEEAQNISKTIHILPPDPHPAGREPEKKPTFVSRHIFIFFLFLIFFLLILSGSIVGGIYLYGVKYKIAPQQNPALRTLENLLNHNTAPNIAGNTLPQSFSPTPKSTISAQSPSQTQSSSGSNTAQSNLQTYTNASDKFSFNYPSGIQVKQASQGLGVSTVELRSADNPDPANSPDFQLLIFPKTLGKLIGQDFDATYALPDGSTLTIKDDQGNTQIFTKIDNRVINSLRALDYQTTANPPDPNTEAEIGTYIEVGGSVVIISTGENDKPTLEQILTSFKYPI